MSEKTELMEPTESTEPTTSTEAQENTSVKTPEALIRFFVNNNGKISGKNLLEVDKKGYSMLSGGDTTFIRLQDLLGKLDSDYKIKQFDKERWLIMKKDKTISDADMEDLNQQHKSNLSASEKKTLEKELSES